MEGRIEAAPNDIENQYIQLETSMMAELDCLPPVSPSRCIYRVPDGLRRVCEEAYTPRIISIGPLHHGKEALRAMEEHKKRYLQYFLSRLTNNLRLKDYIKIVKDQEDKLRSYYSETIELESDEFVRVVLVDAIFIIEFLFRFWYPKLLDENDYIFGKPRKSVDVWFDLHMLENQLPFFILEKLFDPDIFTVPYEYSDRHNGVERLSLLFLSHYFLNDGPTFGGMLHNLETINFSQVQHFVDLLRKLIIDSTLEEQSVAQSKHTTTPSIEELHLAGVKFKVGSTTFEEKCYISDYISIMDNFVDTPKDVELLVKYKIVENHLGGGDNELSNMINKLSTGISYDLNNFYYGILCEDLNNFYSSKWHKSIANLRQNYFNTPWATISFVAGVLLLILTMVQTICSIISLY
ncbi:hypothetical protein M0R45_031327 [Rubus argutus]|uniref:Uncharacterized protein n=1 Tax=Rubus argutus TaxID=59490 RepID=A0AAW1WGX7_RUBAR